MAPRGYVTPMSNRSYRRSPRTPQRSRRRTPAGSAVVSRQRIFRPVSNTNVYSFSQSLSVNVPVTYSTGGSNSRGFMLPGTVAGTSNWGIIWKFTPCGYSLNNRSSGFAAQIFPNQTNFSALFQEVRLNYITIKVWFNSNVANSNLTTTTSQAHFNPILLSSVVLDLNEPVPVNTGDILNYPNLRSKQVGTAASSSVDGTVEKIGFTPRTFSSLSGNNPQNICPPRQWLSVDNGGVLQDHAGLLMYLDSMGLGELQPNGTYGGSFTFQINFSVDYRGLK